MHLLWSISASWVGNDGGSELFETPNFAFILFAKMTNHLISKHFPREKTHGAWFYVFTVCVIFLSRILSSRGLFVTSCITDFLAHVLFRLDGKFPAWHGRKSVIMEEVMNRPRELMYVTKKTWIELNWQQIKWSYWFNHPLCIEISFSTRE